MTVSSRRYLSLWLRRLATDRLERASRAQADRPLVTAAPEKSAMRLAAVNDAARELGMRRGMALADARAMHPSLPVIEADPLAEHALLIAVADWCDRYTPLVGLDPPDGLFLDITGCAHLFFGEAALCNDIMQRLSRQGLHAYVGVADTAGAAWAVARYGSSPIVAPFQTTGTLLPLPLAALRLDAQTVAGLAQAGLKQITDVVARPRAPLAARFGAILLRRLDQALGREDESIKPRLPVPNAMAERRFHEPIAREDDVLGTVEYLARELGRLLEKRGEGARLLQLTLFRADGKVHRLELGTAAPLRDALRIRKLFSERLAVLADECDPGFGFDMIRLGAVACERLDAAQIQFAASGRTADLTHLIDRLSARFGLQNVRYPVLQDRHVPELAGGWRAAHAPATQFALSPVVQETLMPARPIRLFERPEPVDALAEIPDGAPVRFRWRRVLHEVARAEGPERIAMEWWQDEPSRSRTRDYFRVESRAGLRLWLYRDGLYDREPGTPRWFVHGTFA